MIGRGAGWTKVFSILSLILLSFYFHLTFKIVFPSLPPWTSNALCSFFHSPQLNHVISIFISAFCMTEIPFFWLAASQFASVTTDMIPDFLFIYAAEGRWAFPAESKVFNLFRLAQFTNSFLSVCCCVQDTLYENIKLYLSNRTCCWDMLERLTF